MNKTDAFLEIVTRRNEKIDSAPATPLPVSDPVRDLEQYLHPAVQHLKVTGIRQWEGAKSYTLAPDPDRGTVRIAPFSAGQYLSLTLKIGNACITRPISISSGPVRSVQQNAYTITVKRSASGFASDFILDTWEIGTRVDASDPQGQFSWHMVRDAGHVIAIAGGSGITPFRSMAESIADGYDDYDLTILYGSRTEKDILFREDFDAFMAKSGKVHVIHVLSDETKEGFRHGFIDRELIRSVMPEGGPASIFVCGPKGLYDFAGRELAAFGLPQKYIRYELFGAGKNAKAEGKTWTLTVERGEEKTSVPCRDDEPLLVSMERAGILTKSSCRSGVCGVCRSRLAAGDVVIPEGSDGRRLADIKFQWIHPCVTYPASDVTIEITG